MKVNNFNLYKTQDGTTVLCLSGYRNSYNLVRLTDFYDVYYENQKVLVLEDGDEGFEPVELAVHPIFFNPNYIKDHPVILYQLNDLKNHLVQTRSGTVGFVSSVDVNEGTFTVIFEHVEVLTYRFDGVYLNKFVEHPKDIVKVIGILE